MIAEIKASADLHLAKIKDIKDNDDLEESYWRATEAALRKIGADEKADAIEKLIQAKKAERAKEDIDATKDALDQIATLKQDRENLDIEYTRHEIERREEAAKKAVKIEKDKFEAIESINGRFTVSVQKTIDATQVQQLTWEQETKTRYQSLLQWFSKASDAYGKGVRNLNDINGKYAIDQAANLMGSLGELSKKNAKAQKAFAISQAVINTYLGVTKALATLPPPASFITAAATLAAGLANVVKIKGTDETGSGGGGSISGGGMPGITSVIGGGGSALGQPETLLNPNGTAQQQQPQHVYVVESEISSTQRRVQVIENLNRFH